MIVFSFNVPIQPVFPDQPKNVEVLWDYERMATKPAIILKSR